jgi:hypothetical protein
MRTKATRRSTISAVRSFLYWLAKLLGDISAVRKGPNAMVKRLARRQVGRMTSRVRWRWFRRACVIIDREN